MVGGAEAPARAFGPRCRRFAVRRGRTRAGGCLLLAQQAILADQQLEVLALFFGELEEDLLALGVLEPLAVALEEAVRAALAADADAAAPRDRRRRRGAAARRRRRTGRWPRP